MEKAPLGQPSSGISLCMIAKNEAQFLKHALDSVQGVVDEIIFCDTGSTDCSSEIASNFGAKLFHFDWRDDFAAARNFSLRQATQSWILVLDGDEMLSQELAHELRDLAKGEPKGIQFQRVHYEAIAPDSMQTQTALEAAIAAGTAFRSTSKLLRSALRTLDLRLYPNSSKFEYVGRVHEVIQPSVESAGYPIIASDFVIHHFAGLKPYAQKLAKSENYIKLAELKIRELSHKWGPWLELAIEQQQLQRYEQAIPNLEKAIELWPENQKAWFHLGLSQLELGRTEAALQSLHNALLYGANHSAVMNATGVALLRLGHTAQAKECFDAILRAAPDDPVVLCNLGDCYVASGNSEQARTLFEKVLALSPGHPAIAAKLQALRLGTLPGQPV